ncbi:MarR family winged helix-turn-helix transcriptional regulator [Novosphingobium naphthalenivorans]|uniref:MarR family winged helix-turn-helix transcriptional regulator n=1 Tax=Novosphingobium naphthalenivorans TaxID=273168 RepID=UPI001C3F44BA|nr:MarR family transcriptional regulator [Novosphingobium naphthalenivorans]
MFNPPNSESTYDQIKDLRGMAKTDRVEPSRRDAGEEQGSLRQLMEELPLWKRPGYLIRRVHQLHYALFFEEVGESDITPVQYGLMTILSTNPDIDQIAIATKLGIDRTNVADVLRRLERAGLVERRQSEVDRRAKLVRLTQAGREMLSRHYPDMTRAQARLLACLDAKQRDAFLDALVTIIEANNQFGRSSLTNEAGGTETKISKGRKKRSTE